MIPEPVIQWLDQRNHGAISSSRPVGGGCINNGMLLEMEGGASFFLKTNRHNLPDMFAREAEGLAALDVKCAPRVPVPYLVGADFLLMEDLRPSTPQADFWEIFGRQIAALHEHTNECFGFEHDNYCGANPQPNPWSRDGYTFFGEQRLLFQASMAQRRGLLGSSELAQFERLVRRLPMLVPEQPASLSHGDLWTGNAISDSDGAPAIIDPAAHYGWAEAELGMTTLFGSFPHIFYTAYQEVRALEPGFQERFDIYNLYHLLNHLNLFGAGYLGQVRAVLRRYQGP
jgi:protein-ribulosamine 3-kinase